MQGRTPDLVDILIAARQAHHSTVAIQELMHTIGVLHPEDGRSSSVIDVIRTLVLSMPAHRTLVPNADELGRAALACCAVCKTMPVTESSAPCTTASYFCRLRN
jgi:hypothetical protein